jgi:hypothetical protein
LEENKAMTARQAVIAQGDAALTAAQSRFGLSDGEIIAILNESIL